MPRKRGSNGSKRIGRIYTRNQGGVTRFYADFRDFADVGGGREALIPPGERRATTDPDVAAALATKRLQELQAKRQNRLILGITKEATLGSYAAYHLAQKKRTGKVTDQWIAQQQYYLDNAIRFFSVYLRLKALRRDREKALEETRAILAATPRTLLIPHGFEDPPLLSIGVEDVQQWMGELSRTVSRRYDPNDRGSKRRRTYSAGTVRHFLNALSNLYTRAQSEGYVPPGFNPVSALIEKPTGDPDPSTWPPESRTTFTTTFGAPTIESAVWGRTSATQERIRLTIRVAHPGEMIEILRDGSVIATVTPTGDLVTYDDVSDDEGLADPNTEWGERMYTYTARHVSGSILGQESAPVSRWAGPDSPRLTLVQAMSTNQYVVVWEIPPGGANTEVWDNWDDTNHTLSSDFFLAADESDHDASVFVDSEFGPGPGIGPAAGQTIALRIRHRVRNSNVDDYSDFVYTAVKLPSS